LTNTRSNISPSSRRRNVVDVGSLDLQRCAARRACQLLQPLFAGHIAHGRNHVPATPPQFRNKPQAEPARRPDNQRQMPIRHLPAPLHVQIRDAEGVGLDELAAGFDEVAHQGREGFFGQVLVADAHLQ
jgi:hypothetical protein